MAKSTLEQATPLIIAGGIAYLAVKSGLLERLAGGVGGVAEGIGTAGQAAGDTFRDVERVVYAVSQGTQEIVRQTGKSGAAVVYYATKPVTSAGNFLSRTINQVPTPLELGQGIGGFLEASFFGKSKDGISTPTTRGINEALVGAKNFVFSPLAVIKNLPKKLSSVFNREQVSINAARSVDPVENVQLQNKLGSADQDTANLILSRGSSSSRSRGASTLTSKVNKAKSNNLQSFISKQPNSLNALLSASRRQSISR